MQVSDVCAVWPMVWYLPITQAVHLPPCVAYLPAAQDLQSHMVL